MGRKPSQASHLLYFNDITKDNTTRRVKVVIQDATVCKAVAQQLPGELDKVGIKYIIVRANEPSGMYTHSGFSRYIAVKLPVHTEERRQTSRRRRTYRHIDPHLGHQF